MARRIRIEFPGAFYHVMARGNRREDIFHDDDDRRFFLKAVSEACGMTAWRIHAWVLMSNHYHICLETPEANLSAGMGWLQNAYTRRFNTRHRLWGRLFGDRYKAVLIEGGNGYYYQTLLDYIHLNPVRAGLIRPRCGQGVLDYPWSSAAGGHALPPGQRPQWLATESVLLAFGFPDSEDGRRKWIERLDRRASEEEPARCGTVPVPEGMDARCSHLQKGWYWGSQEFAERMRKLADTTRMGAPSRSSRGKGEGRAHDLARAEKLLQQGLEAAGLDSDGIRALPGSDGRKVAIARVIWEQTAVPQTWLAERLGMGSASNVSQQLRRSSDRQTATLPESLLGWLASVSVNG
ncbi:hypothetical protein MAMC_00849 [Methylacidimicrobium cyclopophantes]|uniref:Transposase IS200-like domain-containing protein n=1 Tax=Methylacidimicrobium cyclopophantes TaxID=1041766 RepID=A0A5E6M954_9BACT|nr:transposase [Methylacidimicrobium cyclopophantes]VVM05924.1 hypothetical protein MAMC_00849 [Methylacidimicrobium cyclopophantes]